MHRGLYQSEVTFSLTAMQRPGHQADNSKMVYWDANVLQELIQNAEDAHASQVKFLHDKHSYGTEKLHSRELSQFQVGSISNTKFCVSPLFLNTKRRVELNTTQYVVKHCLECLILSSQSELKLKYKIEK